MNTFYYNSVKLSDCISTRILVKALIFWQLQTVVKAVHSVSWNNAMYQYGFNLFWSARTSRHLYCIGIQDDEDRWHWLNAFQFLCVHDLLNILQLFYRDWVQFVYGTIHRANKLEINMNLKHTRIMIFDYTWNNNQLCQILKTNKRLTARRNVYSYYFYMQ